MLKNTETKINFPVNFGDKNQLFYTKFISEKQSYYAEDITDISDSIIDSNPKIFKKCTDANNYALGSPFFFETLVKSRESILIDGYFDKYMLRSIVNKINQSGYERLCKNIKVLTKFPYDWRGENLAKMINAEIIQELLEPLDINFEIRCTDFSKIHDRFAITDSMLWHFGAAVGNMHPSLSACSVHKATSELYLFFCNKFSKASKLSEYYDR